MHLHTQVRRRPPRRTIRWTETYCGTCSDASACSRRCWRSFSPFSRGRTDDGQCIDVGQGLRQECNLAPLLFNLFFAAMLMAAVAEFDKDPKVTADMVKIGTQVE
ncbi:unnamed protein product [Ectocarpus sp. CCAP 1310/34]|nr:unnamed protein product [Ectocarpus sp. CCAP 1310/34]